MNLLTQTTDLYKGTDLAEIIHQLQADARRAGIDLYLSGCRDAQDIRAKTEASLRYLLQKQPEAVLHLLYLADIPESHARKWIAQYPEEEAAVLCYLLLKKTVEKIGWRKKFSG